MKPRDLDPTAGVRARRIRERIEQHRVTDPTAGRRARLAQVEGDGAIANSDPTDPRHGTPVHPRPAA